MEIVNWIKNHNLNAVWIRDRIFSIDGKNYFWLEDSEKIISEDFSVLASEVEMDLIEASDVGIDRIAFYFGNCWYWTSIDGDTKLNPLRHIGKASVAIDVLEGMPFLGVHGKFELLNGSRDYTEWCRKAKFLGYEILGIAEAQTLAGTMQFQKACQAAGIKSILGQSTLVKSKDQNFFIKLYAMNKVGWRNLLRINKAQLVDNWKDKFIEEEELISRSEGLVAVLNPEMELKPWLVDKYLNAFGENLYFQLDLTEWRGKAKDKAWLESIQLYLSKYSSKLKPVLLQDAYYLDSDEAPLKMALNKIGRIKGQSLSDNQYFKNLDEIYDEFQKIFEEPQIFFFKAVENAIEIGEKCNFEINTKNRYLPKYVMTEEEAAIFSDNGHLFEFKITKGFEEKILPKIKHDQAKIDEYLDRIDEESDILWKGNVVDYFLISSDFCEWCGKNGVLVGHGRGSVAGSLVAYLMNITQVDPLEYGLLFSRFLTEGRLKGSLPDVDSDFSDRDAVVRYLREKYGENYVALVGTYGNMKVKNAIKDFSRINGVNPKVSNYITGFIKKDYEASDFTKLISFAVTDGRFKKFLVDNPKVFQFFYAILHQTRTASIHACATIISPTEDEDGLPVEIHDLMPTKIMDGQLVTEWEGPQLEESGFLKEDILGLKQLEKFIGILKLIEQNHGEKIDIYSIDLNQPEVFEEFGKGLTEDVFQFGTSGLKAYCRSLKPESINELAAANSLYRPGAMESNAHTDFIRIKFGSKQAEYDYLLEDITKETYSIMAYQEQIMKAYSLITDSNLEDADKFRKYVTKAYKLKAKGIKDTEFEKYEKVFLEKYIEKGQNEKDAKAVWEKLQNFASYSFNKSHAVAYSILSYISQWFKVNYPLEFWTNSLTEATDDERPSRLAEIEKGSNISVYPVDVNKSEMKFIGNADDQAIYWSLQSVKWLGEKAALLIIEERKKNGRFFSLKEFISRFEKKNVNKRAITNLILSGGFDQIYEVSVETERFLILDEFFHLIESKDSIDQYIPYKDNKIWWQIIQNELTGFGAISYEYLVNQYKFKDFCKDVQERAINDYVTVSGIVTELKVKKSPKVGEFALLTLDCNNKQNSVMIWNETFELFKAEITECQNKIVILNGQVRFDNWNSQNNVQTNRATKLIVI